MRIQDQTDVRAMYLHQAPRAKNRIKMQRQCVKYLIHGWSKATDGALCIVFRVTLT
jgi:hypothetical protein